MKVESLSIKNFKLFENLEVSFKHKTLDEVSNRFLVLGDNGTGKTTLLQAIALPLALATRQVQTVADFDWLGFLPERFWKWGKPRIQLQVSFVDEEIEATQVVAEKWYQTQSEEFQSEHPFVEPSNNHSTQLTLTGDYWKVGNNTVAERSQFQGRYYARSLYWAGDTSVRSLFPNLPGIFWFDQFRNLGSNPYSETDGNRAREKSQGQIPFNLGVGRLRDSLIQWKQRQTSNQPSSSDSLIALENLYQKIFPKRSFNGIETMPSLHSLTENESGSP